MSRKAIDRRLSKEVLPVSGWAPRHPDRRENAAIFCDRLYSTIENKTDRTRFDRFRGIIDHILEIKLEIAQQQKGGIGRISNRVAPAIEQFICLAERLQSAPVDKRVEPITEFLSSQTEEVRAIIWSEFNKTRGTRKKAVRSPIYTMATYLDGEAINHFKALHNQCVEGSSRGSPGKPVEAGIIEALYDLYREITGCIPTRISTSVDVNAYLTSQKEDGSFLNFCRCFMDEIYRQLPPAEPLKAASLSKLVRQVISNAEIERAAAD